MPGDRRQILSLLRLPIPPLQRNQSNALLNNNLISIPDAKRTVEKRCCL